MERIVIKLTRQVKRRFRGANPPSDFCRQKLCTPPTAASPAPCRCPRCRIYTARSLTVRTNQGTSVCRNGCSRLHRPNGYLSQWDVFRAGRYRLSSDTHRRSSLHLEVSLIKCRKTIKYLKSYPLTKVIPYQPPAPQGVFFIFPPLAQAQVTLILRIFRIDGLQGFGYFVNLKVKTPVRSKLPQNNLK